MPDPLNYPGNRPHPRPAFARTPLRFTEKETVLRAQLAVARRDVAKAHSLVGSTRAAAREAREVLANAKTRVQSLEAQLHFLPSETSP